MLRAAILILGGVFLAQGAFADDLNGDPQAGRKKAGQCRTCHGLDGYAKIPIAPHIGGEPASYIAKQLKAFRQGTRTHEMMSVVAKNLDDQSIADLSAWYSSHEVSTTLPAGKSEEDAPELCVACHGATGIGQVENVPNLAGESAIYIDTQLKAFRLGKRTDEVMSAIAADLTNEEIRDLADWYASVKLEITQSE
ncbi:cytochrome c4 [Rhizobiales bacterium]|uniref:c-type cytochrome n=1 Tax=Hongsoonwoonella zoysiae TaxID=2821844 RepID=UPI001560B938|nr:c-type cytochrome [Hongsoonwoonella zoysiae]NRG17945.1 cytochrome c4 [Hongsoonwoonella zoysiae]